MEDKQYQSPSPTEYSTKSIDKYGSYVARKLGYKLGDDLYKLVVDKLGGEIEIVSPEDYDSSGTIEVRGPLDFTIYLPNYTGKYRDRFTIAHELGHYFVHSKQGSIPIKVDRFGNNEIEWEANHFAAGFLMPENEIRRMHREGRHLLEMASKCTVSKDAMRVRLKFLGL